MHLKSIYFNCEIHMYSPATASYCNNNNSWFPNRFLMEIMHNIGLVQWITFASQPYIPVDSSSSRKGQRSRIAYTGHAFIHFCINIVLSLCHNGGVEKLVLIFHCSMSRVEIRSITTCK